MLGSAKQVFPVSKILHKMGPVGTSASATPILRMDDGVFRQKVPLPSIFREGKAPHRCGLHPVPLFIVFSPDPAQKSQPPPIRQSLNRMVGRLAVHPSLFGDGNDIDQAPAFIGPFFHLIRRVQPSETPSLPGKHHRSVRTSSKIILWKL